MSDTRYPEVNRIVDPVLRRVMQRMAQDLDEMRGLRNQLDATPQIAAEGEVRYFEAGVAGTEAGQYRYSSADGWTSINIDQTARDAADAAQTDATTAIGDAATALAAATGTRRIIVPALGFVHQRTVQGNASGAWPPAYTYTGGVSGGSTNVAYKIYSGALYACANLLLYFPTWVVPGTITAANLLMVGAFTTANSRQVSLEWHDWGGTSDSGDYTATAATDAHAGFDPGSTPVLINEALLNPAANINQSGYTGLRMHVSGGTPTGVNQFTIYNDGYEASAVVGITPALDITYTL